MQNRTYSYKRFSPSSQFKLCRAVVKHLLINYKTPLICKLSIEFDTKRNPIEMFARIYFCIFYLLYFKMYWHVALRIALSLYIVLKSHTLRFFSKNLKSYKRLKMFHNITYFYALAKKIN